MAPRARRVVQYLSHALHPGMSTEWIAFDTDMQRRRNTPSPQKEIQGQGPGQTVRPATPVVACGGPYRLPSPGHFARRLRRISGAGRSQTPPLHGPMHAGETEQTKPDVQTNEDQERLSCQREPRIIGHDSRHLVPIATENQGYTQVIPPLSPSVQMPLQPSVMSTMVPKSTTHGAVYGFFFSRPASILSTGSSLAVTRHPNGHTHPMNRV